MKKSNIRMTCTICLVFLVPISLSTSSAASTPNLPKAADITVTPTYVESYTVPQIFTRFPIDLEKLHGPYNMTHILTPIRISPHVYHSYKAHMDGNFRWYLFCDCLLERAVVYPPASGTITQLEEGYGTEGTHLMQIDGINYLQNCRMEIKINENISVIFDHFIVTEALFNSWEQDPEVDTSDIVGYGPKLYDPIQGAGEVDFSIRDCNYDSRIASTPSDYPCPLNYFTTTIQTEILEYWEKNLVNYTVQGTHLECSLCGNPNINIPGTVWGTWKNVKFDDVTSENSYVTLVKRSVFGNPTTFTKDFDDNPIPSTIAGSLLGMQRASKDDFKGVIVDFITGDDSVGIFHAHKFETAVVHNYYRFEVTKGADIVTGMEDYLLIEGFDTSEQAEEGFTSAAIKFTRDYGEAQINENNNDDNNNGKDVGYELWGILVCTSSVLGVAFVVKCGKFNIKRR